VIFTESNFNRIKDKDNYKDFNKYQTVEEFDTYIENTLDTENINILLNGIVRIINIINKTEEDNGEIEIKELILKANLSRNKNSFKELLVNNLENSDDRIRVINRIIDKKLLDNLDKKIELLIKIEELCEYFYPDFSDKLMQDYHKGIGRSFAYLAEDKKILEAQFKTIYLDKSFRGLFRTLQTPIQT